MYIVYGIPNCDTLKKATAWMQKNKIPFQFYDYKKQGISKEKLIQWCGQVGWEIILNKKGTTWRKLTPEQQATIKTEKNAIKFLLENTSAIKRPLVEKDEKVLVVGFEEITYQSLFK